MWTVWGTPTYLRTYAPDDVTYASGEFYRRVHHPGEVKAREERWDPVAHAWVDARGEIDALDMRSYGGDIPYQSLSEDEVRTRSPEMMRGEVGREGWIERYRRHVGVGTAATPLVAEVAVSDARLAGCTARLYQHDRAFLLELNYPRSELRPLGPHSEWHTIEGDDRSRFLTALGATEDNFAEVFVHAFRDIPDGNIAELMRTLRHSHLFAHDDHPERGPHRNMGRSDGRAQFMPD